MLAFIQMFYQNRFINECTRKKINVFLDIEELTLLKTKDKNVSIRT